MGMSFAYTHYVNETRVRWHTLEALDSPIGKREEAGKRVEYTQLDFASSRGSKKKKKKKSGEPIKMVTSPRDGYRNGTKRKCLQGGLIVSTTKEDERHWDYALCDKTYSDVVAAVSLLLLEANQLDSFYTISSFSFTFANAEARNEIQRECGPAADVPSKPTAPPPPPRENADTIDRNDSRFHIELIG